MEFTTLTKTRLKYVAQQAELVEIWVYRNLAHWLDGDRETALQSWRAEGKYKAYDVEPWVLTVQVNELFEGNFVVVRNRLSHFGLHDSSSQHFYEGLVVYQMFKPVHIAAEDNWSGLPD